MASKRKLGDSNELDDAVDPSDELTFLCLGGGNEVGRSCHIIQYKGKTVMFDAGMHPAYEGLAALPYFDEFDLSQVDVLLISHFHVDHAASLPYVLAKTPFKGRVFMTHATKAIYKWLISDSVRVGNLTSSAESKNTLYNEQDHNNTFPRIEGMDFYATHNVSSIRITPYPAGHVLGAAMYVVEIAGLKMLFTGDYSREDNRHLVSATIPKNIKIDLLICESTFGTAAFPKRSEQETALMRSVTSILDRGGRVLMPIFAIGTAQELLLILEEYWSKHQKYQKIPIYYASSLAIRCMRVYQQYGSTLNENIKKMFQERMAEAEKNGEDPRKAGPWNFRHIRALMSLERFEDLGPCVMLATPGMMQNGASRELLERWAPEQKNGVVITGYSVEGTMAQMIQNEPETINAVMTRSTAGARRGPNANKDEPVQIPRRCTVQEFSFAAHVDGQQNRDFIEEVDAPVIILVHGAKRNMTSLKSKLLSLNASRTHPWRVYSPANCEELRIPFDKPKFAKVVGRLAREFGPPKPGDEPVVISGVMVRNEDHQMSFMAPEDLPEFAGLPITTITERLHLNLGIGPELTRYGLSGYFGHVEEVPNLASQGKATNGNGDSQTMKQTNGSSNATSSTKHPEIEDKGQLTTFIVMDTVLVYVKPSGLIELVWEGNAMNDSIGDAVVAGLTGIAMTPAGVKFSESARTHGGHNHAHSSEEEDGNDDEDDDDRLLASDDSSSDIETALQHRFAARKHPQADWDAADRLERFCWFLEAQFGEGFWSPIVVPRGFYDEATMGSAAREREGTVEEADLQPTKREDAEGKTSFDLSALLPSLTSASGGQNAIRLTPAERAALSAPECATELARLHGLGILIPGFELRLDAEGKSTARLWCEDLDIECSGSKVWRERIAACVRNAVGALRPLGKGEGGGEGWLG